MRSALFCSVALSIIVLGGCGDDGTGPGEVGPDWFPGEAGSYWHFDISGTVVQVDDTLDVSGVQNYDITADTTHSQGFAVMTMISYQSVTLTPQGGGDSLTLSTTDTLYVHNTDEVLEVYPNLESSDHDIMLQFPLTAGDTWFLNSYQEDILEVMSLDEDVTVPTGTYSGCALVQMTPVEADGSFLNRFYADGVGPVLMIYHAVEEYQVIDYSYELTNYLL